jgi:hypothetical protein
MEVVQGYGRCVSKGCSHGTSCRGGNGGDAGVLERPFRRWHDRLRDEGQSGCAIAVSASCRAVSLRQ